jgi:hypothetical protein
LLRKEGLCVDVVRTWNRSNDPNIDAKRDRIVELYALAAAGRAVVTCLDEFGGSRGVTAPPSYRSDSEAVSWP